MNNQMTDRLRLVRSELVKAIPAFGRTIVAVENYSLEIFRGEFHLGSVRINKSGIVNNEGREYAKMKVYNGDVLFWVSLVPQPISISGHITTEDKFVQIYDITFDVIVRDSVAFVQGYRRGKDPVNVAIRKFKVSLQEYASHYQHDKLTPIKRPSDEWNKEFCTETGMVVQQISYWSIREDPKRAEMDTILLEAEKSKVSVTKQAEIQKLKERLDNEREAEQRAFDREEQTRQHIHELHLRLRETAAQELTAILRERIRDTFERGAPISEVAEDSMKLLNAFHDSLHRGSIVDSTLSNVTSTRGNGIPPKKEAAEREDPETDPLSQTSANLSKTREVG